MYYSKKFYEDTVVVKVSYKNEVEYLTFEDIDFEEVINMLSDKEYDRDIVSDIMYDMLCAINDYDEANMVVNYEVILCISQPEWVGCGGESV